MAVDGEILLETRGLTRGFAGFSTIRTVIIVIAGKLDI